MTVVIPCCPHGVDVSYRMVVSLSLSLSLYLSIIRSQDHLVFAIDRISRHFLVYQLPECVSCESGSHLLVLGCRSQSGLFGPTRDSTLSLFHFRLPLSSSSSSS